VKLPTKYKKTVEMILTTKAITRHNSTKASKPLGMKNLASETSLWDEKSYQ
jgi:hypothetical protein